LLGKIADSLVAYLNAQLAAGAHALQIFDSWAGALGPEDYAKFGAPYIARVIAGLERNPQDPQPVIVFGVETGELLAQLAATGADVVGVDWRVPLDEARGRVGPAVALQGNLDPATLFLPLREQQTRVARVLELADGAGAGHIFNLGHGVIVGTPVEAAARFPFLASRRPLHSFASKTWGGRPIGAEDQLFGSTAGDYKRSFAARFFASRAGRLRLVNQRRDSDSPSRQAGPYGCVAPQSRWAGFAGGS